MFRCTLENLNQSWSAFIRAPNFYFICYISRVIFVCRLLAASFCVPLPPSRRHRSWFQQLRAYVPFFPQSAFGFSYPAVSYWISFEVCVFHRAFCNWVQPWNLTEINWVWGPCWPIGKRSFPSPNSSRNCPLGSTPLYTVCKVINFSAQGLMTLSSNFRKSKKSVKPCQDKRQKKGNVDPKMVMKIVH